MDAKAIALVALCLTAVVLVVRKDIGSYSPHVSRIEVPYVSQIKSEVRKAPQPEQE